MPHFAFPVEPRTSLLTVEEWKAELAWATKVNSTQSTQECYATISALSHTHTHIHRQTNKQISNTHTHKHSCIKSSLRQWVCTDIVDCLHIHRSHKYNCYYLHTHPLLQYTVTTTTHTHTQRHHADTQTDVQTHRVNLHPRRFKKMML